MRIKYEFHSMEEIASFFIDKAKEAETAKGKLRSAKLIAVLECQMHIWTQAASIVRDAIIVPQKEEHGVAGELPQQN